MQPLYGFGSEDPARFARAAGHQDLLYVHDSELSFEQVFHFTLMWYLINNPDLQQLTVFSSDRCLVEVGCMTVEPRSLVFPCATNTVPFMWHLLSRTAVPACLDKEGAQLYFFSEVAAFCLM